MIVLPNMGLVKWDNLNDAFSHEQLAANFQALDTHDHTAGKGVKIPYGGLAEPSVGKENLREGVLNTTNASSYRVIRFGTGVYDELTSGNRYFSTIELLRSSTLAQSVELFNLTGVDFAATGFTPKLRTRATCVTKGTAPGVNLTVGLYPVTAVSGTALTVGSAISGSTAEFVTPGLNTITSKNSGDFTLPSDNTYVVGVACSGTTAGGGGVTMHYQLQLHYV